MFICMYCSIHVVVATTNQWLLSFLPLREGQLKIKYKNHFYTNQKETYIVQLCIWDYINI